MKVINEAANKKRLVENEETEVVDVTVKPEGGDIVLASKEDVIKVKNALTDILDRALDDAEFALANDEFNENCNVLVTGLPGSSKTKTVEGWCHAHGCNYYYLDAKNPDLAVLLSGASCIDKSDPEHPRVVQAFSGIYKKLQQPRLILFLDELNRQVREYLRGSLLTLIANRALQGDTEDGYVRIPNLLFTIACVNPAMKEDKGATKLNEAEKRRFYYHVQFDSTVESTDAFLTANYDQKLRKIAANPTDPRFNEKVRINILSQYIGKVLISDRRFRFSTKDDLKTSYNDDTKILCQSVVTELISHSRGDISKIIQDLQTSGLAKKDIDTLTEILNGITLPDYLVLLRKKEKELGLDLGSAKLARGGAATDELADKLGDSSLSLESDDDELDFSGADDDDEDFVFSGASGSKHAEEAKISDAEAKSRIMSTLDSILSSF